MNELTIPTGSNNFTKVKDRITSDNKGRVGIGQQSSGRRFRVYQNESGQILLDPVFELSKREIDFLADPDRLEAWNRAVKDSQLGNLQSRDEF